MNNEKNKRVRIGEVKVEETKIEEVNNQVENSQEDLQDVTESYYDENGEFMWDAYEASCPSKTRKPNPHIKTLRGDKVFSREDYAQDFYDLLAEFDSKHSLITKLNAGEIHEGKIYGVSSEFISVVRTSVPLD